MVVMASVRRKCTEIAELREEKWCVQKDKAVAGQPLSAIERRHRRSFEGHSKQLYLLTCGFNSPVTP